MGSEWGECDSHQSGLLQHTKYHSWKSGMLGGNDSAILMVSHKHDAHVCRSSWHIDIDVAGDTHQLAAPDQAFHSWHKKDCSSNQTIPHVPMVMQSTQAVPARLSTQSDVS